MPRFLALAALATILPLSATAQHVTHCEWQADARSIVEPWENHIQSYANGEVRVALMDLLDPAAGSLHILVLTPPYTAGIGERHCHIVGWSEGVGFVTIDFAGVAPTYDPATGLGLAFPVRFYDPELDFSNIGLLSLTINQATGNVTADFTVTGQD